MKKESCQLLPVLFAILGMLALARGEEEYCQKKEDGSCAKEIQEPKKEPLRLILVGKTGSGKSSTANSIIGEDKYKVGKQSISMTRKSQLEKTEIDGRTLEVMDCPGLFDTSLSHTTIAMEIVRALGSMSPGPHAFLYVVPAALYTKEDLETYERLKKMFEKVADHMVVVFTHLDNLTRDGVKPDDFIKDANKHLKTVLDEVQGRYVFFDNSSKDRKQVLALVEAVLKIGGEHYVEPHLTSLSEDILKELLRNMNKEFDEKNKELKFDDKKQFIAGQWDKSLNKKSTYFKTIWGFVQWLYGQ